MYKKFKEWVKVKEMAGTGAVVSCKDRGAKDYQIWGAMSDLKCNRKKKKK